MFSEWELHVARREGDFAGLEFLNLSSELHAIPIFVPYSGSGLSPFYYYFILFYFFFFLAFLGYYRRVVRYTHHISPTSGCYLFMSGI